MATVLIFSPLPSAWFDDQRVPVWNPFATRLMRRYPHLSVKRIRDQRLPVSFVNAGISRALKVTSLSGMLDV